MLLDQLCIHRPQDCECGRNALRRPGNTGPVLALYMLSSTCLYFRYVHQDIIPRYPTGAPQGSLYFPTSNLVFLIFMCF